MNIYSDSFFHRIREYDVLPLILEQGFKVFYCMEEIFRGRGIPSTSIGIPMVSFCDIPLSFLSKNHYGNFGIAMSRRWGNTKHLEPVLYYPNNKYCQSTKMVNEAADNFISNRKKTDAYRILGYSKPMTKPTKKEGQSSDNYVEREWRKVYANRGRTKWLTEEELKSYKGEHNSPKRSIGNPLKFNIEDVDLILVDKQNVQKLQEFIMNKMPHLGGNTDEVTEKERWALLSKILVYEDLIRNL